MPGRKTLQARYVTIVGRHHDSPTGGVVDRETAAHFSTWVFDITHIGAGMRSDEELAPQAHVDTVVVAVGDEDRVWVREIRVRHTLQIHNVERAAKRCAGRGG